MFHEKRSKVGAIVVGRVVVREGCILCLSSKSPRISRKLCTGTSQTAVARSLNNFSTSSDVATLVAEYTTVNIVTGLPEHSATRILSLSWWARRQALHGRETSINPTPPFAACASFGHADAAMNVHLSTLQYSIQSSVCTLLCSCIPRISTPRTSAQCASSTNLASPFAVHALKVTITNGL